MNINEKLFKAQQDVEDLYWQKEKWITDTNFGTIVGHFAGNEYFFFKTGKELFRSSDKNLTTRWLVSIYKSY